ncbi:amino acid transporter [Pestalotiopsis sp. IQ-011]
MKHKPVDPQTASSLDTLMGVDANKKRKEHKPHDVKPEIASGISDLMGLDVKATSHDNQLRGREGETSVLQGNGAKADAVLGTTVSGGMSRQGSRGEFGPLQRPSEHYS